jgi:hypothetical protein
MTRRRRLSVLALIFTAAWAQTPGVRPRQDAGEYPAREHIPGATIAAALLSAAQVKSAFGTDTYKGFIVMEVAVFPDTSGPDANGRLELSPKDFMVKINSSGELLRYAAPSTVALSIDEKNNPTHPPEIRGPVDVSTTSTIGYDSAGSINPNTGKRQGAVYTATEVDIAPAGTMRNNRPLRGNKGRGFDTMEAELSAKALPEVTVTQPIAGYLYFMPPKKKAGGSVELSYSSDAGRAKLLVPGAAR